MDRSTAKVITWVVILLLLLIKGIAVLIGSKTLAYLSGLFGIIIIVAVQLPFHTCPHCGRMLGRHHLSYTHCPHCGELLED